MDITSVNTGITAGFDIRIEALIAAILGIENENFWDPEYIIIALKGHGNRRSHREVEQVIRRWRKDELYLFFDINRKGLFDTLPESLFLKTDGEFPTVKAKIRAIQEQKENVRKFFSPFEQALYLPRIKAEQLEQKWTEQFPGFIENIWGLDSFKNCLNDQQIFQLCYLIPLAPRISGDWMLTQLCFESILGKPVNIKFIAPEVIESPKGKNSLAELALGEDATLGDTFLDDLPTLEVVIEDIGGEDLQEYLFDGKKKRVLEELLYSYFIPLEVVVITRIHFSENAFDITLKEAILGYNVRLKEQMWI